MMSQSLIKQKNEILRKIRLMRLKETKLPELKRKLTEQLLEKRKMDQ